jgi:GDP/UDP-N,N'-diacetylbacillosamine 2-epimerase (hydrolysing)
MGEEDWRVCVCGEPGLDNLYRQPLMTLDELQIDLRMNFSRPTALVTFHPVTLELDDLSMQLSELFKALDLATELHGLQYLITFPNADPGSSYIIDAWEVFVNKRPGCKLVKSLGQTRYLSALSFLSMMIGNSSSGLVEAPSFSMPVVNIGNRQKGRMRGKNVFDVGYSVAEIKEGIDQAMIWDKNKYCFNPYGNGNSASKILDHLRYVFSKYGRKEIITKKFTNSKEVRQVESNFYAKYSN